MNAIEVRKTEVRKVDEQVLKNIGVNVRRLRGDNSMSWLAFRARTFPANISRIESGKNMPGVGLLVRVADALGVSPNDLLGRVGG